MTYCAIASFSLASRLESISNPKSLLRWLVDRQVLPPLKVDDDSDDSDEEEDVVEPVTVVSSQLPAKDIIAGFQGRIGKDSDACYSFWCNASIQVSFCAVSRWYYLLVLHADSLVRHL